MTWVWQNSTQSEGRLLLLLALADFADDSGYCYPGLQTLAKKSRMSERNVRYALRDLEAAGELQTALRAGPNGTNAYRVLCPTGAKIAPATRSPRGAKSDSTRGSLVQAGGAVSNGQVGQFATQVGHSIAPDPSVDPSDQDPSNGSVKDPGSNPHSPLLRKGAETTEIPIRFRRHRKTALGPIVPVGGGVTSRMAAKVAALAGEPLESSP